jgi:hypothetical protein
MKVRKVWILPVLLAGIILLGCSPKSRYERRLKQELASGERYDTLFMGIYLGMSDKDFYSHCWLLNREGLIRQGSGNMSVQRELKDELKHPATMDFYPEFGQGKIVEMPVKYVYTGWAPWNKELSSESLQADILNKYSRMYGKGFIKVEHPDRGAAYIKIDGNRRITIYTENDMNVWAIFTDMSAAIPNDSTSETGARMNEITKQAEE